MPHAIDVIRWVILLESCTTAIESVDRVEAIEAATHAQPAAGNVYGLGAETPSRRRVTDDVFEMGHIFLPQSSFRLIMFAINL